MAEASTYVNSHASETVQDLATLTNLDRAVAAGMKRTAHIPNVRASDLQPVIDAAAKYKAIDRAFPAGELISDAAVR
jgi:hypothetical protein